MSDETNGTEKTEAKDEGLSEKELAALELAKAVYGSILETAIPQEIMESVGKAIQVETQWGKLTGKNKIALFRVATILQDKLPKIAIDCDVCDMYHIKHTAKDTAGKPSSEPTAE